MNYHHRLKNLGRGRDHVQGRIQDFKLGGALKKVAPSGGRRENFGDISCEKSRYYAKKSYFFPILGGGGPTLGAPPPDVLLIFKAHWVVRERVMVFNATFNNNLFISWRSMLLMDVSWVSQENHRPVASH